MSGPDGGGAEDPVSGGAPLPRVHQLKARYVRRVTPDHLGERVSIRHLYDDPDRGPVPTDVVGRLVGADEGAMLVVDRAGQLTVVDPARVLASRVVPPHPRLPPEPPVGTEDAPLYRAAARVLLLDAADRILLVAHAPDPHRRVWTAPGGGLRPGEDHRDGARRELEEEIGITLEPGPWVWSRRVTFVFRGCWLDQEERWFLTRTDTADAGAAPLDDPGAVTARWWPLPELHDTDAEVAPRALADHLATLLRDGAPDTPVDVGR